MKRIKITEDHIGRLAYKKNGFFGGLIGRIERSKYEHAPSDYIIEFPGGGGVGIVNTSDIEFIDS